MSRSHARDTTKIGKAAALPIADELLPYVKARDERNPSTSDVGRRGCAG